MDIVTALLVMLGGVRHSAPASYHAPVRTLPLVAPADPGVLSAQHWGPACSR
jgi:hypothetical protein